MKNIARLISTPIFLWWSIYPYAKSWECFSLLIPISRSHDFFWASMLLPQFLAAVTIGPVIGGLVALMYGRAYLPMSILFAAPTCFVLIYTESSSSHTALRWAMLGYQVFSYGALLIGTSVIARRIARQGLTVGSTRTKMLRIFAG